MISHFNYFTYLIYSTRGNSETALTSRKFVGKCKNGDLSFANLLAEKIKSSEHLSFFDNSILIPIPRSSPTVDNALFPSKILADKFLKQGIVSNVSICLVRSYAIPKSSNQSNADDRNSVETQFKSLHVVPEFISEPNIILIDDVLTLGRTAMASAMKIQDAYPDAKVKIFCAFRTRGFEDKEVFISPDFGEMKLTSNHKVQLPD